jgi:excisionase family DNA binding protein
MPEAETTHGIAVYVDGKWAERGEITLTEAAKMLDLSPLTVLRWIRAGIIPAEQYCKGAPWVIKRRDIEGHDLVERVKAARKGSIIINSRSVDPYLSMM